MSMGMGMEEEMARNGNRNAIEPHVNLKRIENTIFFSDRINYNTAHKLCVLLRQCELDTLEDMGKVKDSVKKDKTKHTEIQVTAKPIVLVLTTHGGIDHAAYSIVDTIHSLKVPVHTVVSGYVASAGTLISLAGAKRFMSPNSFMMIHEIRSGFWGKYSDTRIEYENVTKLMEHLIQYYLEKTQLTRERLTEMLRTDTDMTAKECLSVGLIDAIGMGY